MLSKNDRAKLIAALNTALSLYIADKQSQAHFATIIGQTLDVSFLDHFVEGCIKN